MFRLSLIIYIFLIAVDAQAQDMIYYSKNKTDKWRVTEVNPQYIKAVDVADPEMSYSTTPANVLFVFNKQGDFLVIPKLYQEAATAEQKIKSFFQPKNIFHEFDKIITWKNEIIICTYESLDADKIIYKVDDKPLEIQVSKVAVLIFKSGDHKMFSSADKVYKTLAQVQEKFGELSLSHQGSAAGPSVAAGSPGDKPAINHAALPAAKTVDSVPAGNLAGKPADTGSASTGSVPGGSATTQGGTAQTVSLDSRTISRLQEKAIANIGQLGDYLQVICQKDTDPDELNKTIEQALNLFITDARIEVSSINRSTVNQFRIRDYLVRMSLLKYSKVLIEWYNIQYTSQLRKGPDGFYYGTIEFEQRFVGIRGDNGKYEDITRKSVEVVLKTYERNAGGQTTLEWEVFLGDIGVTVTKSA